MTEKDLSDEMAAQESDERLREEARERAFLYRAEDEDVDAETKTRMKKERLEEEISDAELIEVIVEHIAALRNIEPSDIRVEVQDGAVTLLGRVPSEREKRTVEIAVLNVDGVKSIDNRMKFD
ncbi:MAG TPA: BON domain-containing protein [Anaerolineaceae bacterium]|nr:BON domain-containing protein [Anaerolineaceae bacterium]